MEYDPLNVSPEKLVEKPSIQSSMADEMGGFADAAAVRGHVQQLNLLTSRLEEFLTSQINRLQKMDPAIGIGQAIRSEELERMVEEFEQTRRNWEVERQTTEDRLRHDAERLQAAWQALEMEQRTLLSQQAVAKSTARSAALAASASASGPVASNGMYPTRSSASRAVTTTTTSTRSGDSEMTPSHRAQVQFQQLRREMQKHAQRRNKR